MVGETDIKFQSQSRAHSDPEGVPRHEVDIDIEDIGSTSPCVSRHPDTASAIFMMKGGLGVEARAFKRLFHMAVTVTVGF